MHRISGLTLEFGFMKRAICVFMGIVFVCICVQAKSAKPVSSPKAEAAGTPKPPFGGTIFVCRNIITDDDPTAFKSVVAAGRGERKMFDRRPGKPHKINAYLFTATFDDGQTMEIRVNPEFGAEGAMAQAKKYLPYIGQMPFALRKDIEKVLIHKGKKGFGGGGKGILIHTDMGDSYIRGGILAETLCHEASHTSLDRTHSTAKGWLAAQKSDGAFISGYAKGNPRREDVAESYLLYFAVRYKPHRIDDKLRETITKTIPNRIAYFDAQNLPMHPVAPLGALARLTCVDVQNQLKLSDDQKTQIDTLRLGLIAEVKKLEKQQAKICDLERQYDAKSTKLLTAGQRKALEGPKEQKR